MKIETNKLLRVSTYAKQIYKSPQWVRDLIKHGKLKSVTIDEVIFVIK